MNNATACQREFGFSDQEFEYIRIIVKQNTGINLSESKRELVYSRLTKRLRELKLRGFDEYCALLQEHDENELGRMVNAITTNLTSFFREKHHFDFLTDTLLPRLLCENAGRRRLRIWCAGCSTGQEAYSLAIVVKEAVQTQEAWDIRILATDLDSSVIAQGKAGIYPDNKLDGLSASRLHRWFLRGKGQNSGKVRVVPDLRNIVTFRQLNLIGEWPFRGPFDIILCRNVIIYFDKPTQQRLVDRYADILTSNGYLFLGHSETLHSISDRFKLAGTTLYRKIA